ncbi:permease [Scopulibacillus cellulosilyticus]|uniref:Permease n=1 Tax=Scopulibacillus cellulosilyticus TaxID=2665665 RepID=A0ABW2PVE9_9BACL
MNEQTQLSSHIPSSNRKRWIAGAIIFIIAAIIGLYWVKWHPYYGKALNAVTTHSVGSSIISGGHSKTPEPSWSAAWQYSVAYFQSIWKAFVVGLILASLIQVLIPRDWFRRVLGKTTYGSTVIAGLSALPGMMCTCCTAPLVVGMRKQASSVSAAAAFWFGNTALNPAVLVFMFFVLGWKFTVLRLIFGIIIVFGLSYLAGRIAKEQDQPLEIIQKTANNNNDDPKGRLPIRWLKNLGSIVLTTLPIYIISVFVLGAFRAWLFPIVGGDWGNGILAIIIFAIAGTLFVIPTAGEIPIVQAFMAMGLGTGPAAALAITLPVISLPSMLMVRRALSWRTLIFLGISIMILGIISGLIGMFFL